MSVYHTHTDRFFWGAGADKPVAFLDETYRLDYPGEIPFYALSAVLVYPGDLDAACDAVLDANDGEPPHATELYQAGGMGREDLCRVIEVAAENSQWGYVTVKAPLVPGDDKPRRDVAADLMLTPGDVTRATCLDAMIRHLNAKWGCLRFVIEGRETLGRDRQDLSVLQQVRTTLPAAVDASAWHRSRRTEPLLCLPDALAWAWRQDLIGRRTPVDWYKPFRYITDALSVRGADRPLFAPTRHLTPGAGPQ
jgi:hypothetical protein